MLEGRYALILGGDSEVGGAVARLYAKHGAKIAVAVAANGVSHGGHESNGTGESFERPELNETSESRRTHESSCQLESSKIHASCDSCESFASLTADIPGCLIFETPMAPVAMSDLCDAVLRAFPYVDILVGATNAYGFGATIDFPVSNLISMLETNLGCAVKCLRHLLPGMLNLRRGDIVLLAPDFASVGLPHADVADMPCDYAGIPHAAAAAAACAGAIASFVRNVSMDYVRYRVRANTIAYPYAGIYAGPDNVVAASNAAGAPDTIATAANAALWFACDMSRYVIGETLRVKSSISCAPGETMHVNGSVS